MNNPVKYTDPDGTWVPEYDKDNNKVLAKYQDGDTYEDLYTQLGITAEQFAKQYKVDLSKGISKNESIDITNFILKGTDFLKDNLNMNCFSSSLYGSGAISQEMHIDGGNNFTEDALETYGFEKVEQQTTGSVTTWKDENNITNYAVIYLLKDQRGTQYFIGRPGQNSKVDIQISKTTNSLYPNFQQIFLKYSSSQPKY